MAAGAEAAAEGLVRHAVSPKRCLMSFCSERYLDNLIHFTFCRHFLTVYDLVTSIIQIGTDHIAVNSKGRTEP